jgi:hypothetical protein
MERIVETLTFDATASSCSTMPRSFRRALKREMVAAATSMEYSPLLLQSTLSDSRHNTVNPFFVSSKNWGIPLAGAKRGPKRLEDIADPVLRRIFQVMPRWGTSQAELCHELEIDKSHFSRNRVRGVPIDLAILERVAWRSGARVRWLQFGEEPIYAPEGEGLSAYADDLQSAIRRLRDASPQAQVLLARVARLLGPGHPDVMRDVTRMIDGIEFANRAWIDNTPETPD